MGCRVDKKPTWHRPPGNHGGIRNKVRSHTPTHSAITAEEFRNYPQTLRVRSPITPINMLPHILYIEDDMAMRKMFTLLQHTLFKDYQFSYAETLVNAR